MDIYITNPLSEVSNTLHSTFYCDKGLGGGIVSEREADRYGQSYKFSMPSHACRLGGRECDRGIKISYRSDREGPLEIRRGSCRCGMWN